MDKTDGKWDTFTDSALKKVLKEAYHAIPFLLPLRLIVDDEAFADFFIKQKDALVGGGSVRKRRSPTRRKTTRRKTTSRTTKRTTKPRVTAASTTRRRKAPRTTTRRRAKV
jgi:hypothetical protein